jgi:hypothetical protein
LGLRPEKFEEEGRQYRWGEKVVFIPLELKGKAMNIPLKLGNPDIKAKPVQVKIFIDKKMVEILDLRDNDWHTLRYSIENTERTEIPLKIEVSRTWNPYLVEGRLYPWDLGPAIGEIFWSP